MIDIINPTKFFLLKNNSLKACDKDPTSYNIENLYRVYIVNIYTFIYNVYLIDIMYNNTSETRA